VIIKPRRGLVPLDEAHLSWTLVIDGNFIGHYQTYSNAEVHAKAMTLNA
jgi:hypothetical protein